ncbi:YafY family protein [uncultured Limimaricola sp.]|uniref:helix-turn-helix transcriptional regulator n=1 Tax=uncultured Limimaricola sp. TaxID=2211667 RepID=UPI0030F9BAE2
MSRSARLLRLLTVLRSRPGPVTAAQLARETEVSERTLYRDIASLRTGGALIDGAPGFGYTLTEDPALPPQSFDRIEMEALVLGLSDVRQRGDPQMARAAETALAKIAATLPERLQRQILHATHMVHRFGAPAQQAPDLSVIRAACWDECALDIAYRDAHGIPSTRRIHPLAVVYLDTGVGVLAFCCLRQAFRKFRVARIEAVTPTNESFRPNRARLLRAYLAELSEN